MSTSVFGWLDYDDRDRLQMMEIVNLFREKSTLDELGSAQVRDGFSDHFFPGTSTVQTRARYFLFVPWIQMLVDQEGLEGAEAARRERVLNSQLVKSLIADDDTRSGIIGRYAGESLQRLPSYGYWTGLSAWGIRLSGESLEQYDALRQSRRSAGSEHTVAESGELVTQSSRSWHPSIPGAPDSLFDQVSFDLTPAEAEFLQERIMASCRGTLLEGCLRAPISNVDSARFPWELNGLEHLDKKLQSDIEHARRFALLAEGAANLYNLMLAESARELPPTSDSQEEQIVIEKRDRRVEDYSHRFSRWADEVDDEQGLLIHWDRTAFWQRARDFRPTLRPGTQRFFDRWMEMAIADPRSLSASDEARSLISNRERLLKGSLARLHHRRPLERWSGASGLGRMSYRWATARSHVRDILDGLGRSPEGTHA